MIDQASLDPSASSRQPDPGLPPKFAVFRVTQGTLGVSSDVDETFPRHRTADLASDNLASKTEVSVSAGSFTATLPGKTVTTFVGN